MKVQILDGKLLTGTGKRRRDRPRVERIKNPAITGLASARRNFWRSYPLLFRFRQLRNRRMPTRRNRVRFSRQVPSPPPFRDCPVIAGWHGRNEGVARAGIT